MTSYRQLLWLISSEEYDKWMKGEEIRLKTWCNNIQNHFSDLAI